MRNFQEAERSLKYYRGVDKDFGVIDHNLKLELENLKQALNESNDKGTGITWEDFGESTKFLGISKSLISVDM